MRDWSLRSRKSLRRQLLNKPRGWSRQVSGGRLNSFGRPPSVDHARGTVNHSPHSSEQLQLQCSETIQLRPRSYFKPVEKTAIQKMTSLVKFIVRQELKSRQMQLWQMCHWWRNCIIYTNTSPRYCLRNRWLHQCCEAIKHNIYWLQHRWSNRVMLLFLPLIKQKTLRCQVPRPKLV